LVFYSYKFIAKLSDFLNIFKKSESFAINFGSSLHPSRFKMGQNEVLQGLSISGKCKF